MRFVFAVEALVRSGKVRSVGVSNFSVKKLRNLMTEQKQREILLSIPGEKEYVPVYPAVNQVELHPRWRQDKLLLQCKSLGVHVTAYSPLGSPDSASSQLHEYRPREPPLSLATARIRLLARCCRLSALVPVVSSGQRP